MTATRTIEYMPLDQIISAERNPKGHDLAGIGASIDRFGYVEAVVLDERTGRLVAGHGRCERLREKQASGEAPPDGITVDEQGRWNVPVTRGWSSHSDLEAEAFIVASNRLTETGGWDPTLLAEMLSSFATIPEGFAGVGYDPDDLDALLRSLDPSQNGQGATDELENIRGDRPDRRTLPIDMIFTLRPTNIACYIASEAGFLVGTRSDAVAGALERERPRYEWRFRIEFVDNDFHHYNHLLHRDVVAELRPKYATVMDVMSKTQAEEAGVKWHPFDQIMEWAEELEQHCENVIVIPKIDILDDIPERYMLGYSVQSSYGSTPIPAERFKGRRVHLLGGSWKNQLAYLSLLGDSVVSADINSIYKNARFGNFCEADGQRRDLQDVGQWPENMIVCAVALSIGNMSRTVKEMYGIETAKTRAADWQLNNRVDDETREVNLDDA